VPGAAAESSRGLSQMTDDADLPLVSRNIRQLRQAERDLERGQSSALRMTASVSRFLGSVPALASHALLLLGWLLWNTGALGLTPFDPFPFPALGTFAAVEAIFLTMIVLTGQNRLAVSADQRADLELQVTLLAEHETTKLLALVDEMAKAMGVARPDPDTIHALKQDVEPRHVLGKLDKRS
jgi:uncharacterized membrane protein